MTFEYKIARRRRGQPLLLSIQDNKCWLITSHALNEDGYGKIQIDRKTFLIHRLVYEQHHNIRLTPDLIVRHKCDIPSCCNPDHLEIGSVNDNVQDRVKRNRGAKGENHGRAKLTNEQVIEIFNNRSESQTKIAEKYGVSQKLVSLIHNNKTRKDVLNDKF